MIPRLLESTLPLLTMLVSVDVFVDLFPECQAQPWFNVHVIQEYLNLTGKSEIAPPKSLPVCQICSINIMHENLETAADYGVIDVHLL